MLAAGAPGLLGLPAALPAAPSGASGGWSASRRGRAAWRAAEGCLREALGLAAGVSDLSLALEIAAYGVLLSPAPSVRRRWAQVEAGLREAREADAGERTATRATPALQGTNSEV